MKTAIKTMFTWIAGGALCIVLVAFMFFTVAYEISKFGNFVSGIFSSHSNETEVQQLLDAGIDPHETDDNGKTLLMMAAARGHVEGTNALLSAGANPNIGDNDGVTSLMEAAIWGHAEVAKILLSANANPYAAD